ncbi:unnamed protein product [Phytophthora fragariaefolia]|uniref:Unnamed protein product n=1 Tax=Phytophthora fragariaefolia TaxID=1490495 RepID=A0A9W7CPZ5_9STRA|nr:unnamed protein product [Phytophthora fragariaefolia]
MPEPTPREFVSQWTCDRGQDRADMHEEITMQCIGVDRVAKVMRQRHEHNLKGNFDTVDFETRITALGAHIFQAPRYESPRADLNSPATVGTTRIRPQSASLARDNCATSNKTRLRQRPQSAKHRSEVTHNLDQIDWNASTQEKPSKWREMLARGPGFKQLTLRRLELETYELLYKTLDQRRQLDEKSPTRRRRKSENADNVAKLGQGQNRVCGSGLHLARNRKKRQQEHDRRMMLGKSRHSPCGVGNKKSGGIGEEKQAIQEKTRRRNKSLNQKKYQQRLEEYGADDQMTDAEKHSKQPHLQQPSTGHRSTRGPWIPSGSQCSLGIRGISSGMGEFQLPAQEQRIAQVFEAFQSHAKAHLRLSKRVQKHLKKAQTRAATTNATEQSAQNRSTSKCSAKQTGLSSAPSNSDSRIIGNQENDQVEVVRVVNCSAPLSSLGHTSMHESKPFLRESPVTPRLVVPPLKLPPNLWEYQLSGDTLDGNSKRKTDRKPSVTPKDSNTIVPCAVVALDAIAQQEMYSKPHAGDRTIEKLGTSAPSSRRATIEDIYIAEGDMEQANSARLSTGNSGSPPVLLEQTIVMLQVCLSNEDDVDASQKLVNNDSKDISTHAPSDMLPTEMENAPSRLRSNPLAIPMISARETSPKIPVRLYDVPEQESSAAGARRPTLNKLVPSPVSSAVKNIMGDSKTWDLQANTEGTNASESTENTDSITENHCTSSSNDHSVISDDLVLRGDYSASGRNEATFDESAKMIKPCMQNSGSILFVSDSLNVDLKDSANNFTSKVCADHRRDEFQNDKYMALKEKQSGCSTPMGSSVSVHINTKFHPLDQQQSFAPSLPNADSVNTEGSSEIVPTMIEGPDRNESVVFLSNDKKCDELPSDSGERLGEVVMLPNPHPEPNVSTVSATQYYTISTEVAATTTIKVGGSFASTEDKNAIKKSPKRKSKKPKDTSTGKIAKSKTAKPFACLDQTDPSQSVPSDASTSALLQPQTSSTEDLSRGGKDEEDPLRLHQQEVTRSFLKRISSRKVVELKSSSTPPQINHELCGELTSGKAIVTAVGSAVKERGDSDGDAVSENVSKSESTVEKPGESLRSRASTDIAMTSCTENVNMVTGFVHSVDDGSTSSSTMTQNNPDAHQDVNVKVIYLAEECQVQAQPESNIRNDGNDTNETTHPHIIQLASDHHHHAACKIQAQYRCFVRSRAILDQLSFLLAQQRREVRRKSRVKTKKTKDIVSPLSIVKSVTTSDVKGIENNQQVGHATVIREIDALMPSAAGSNEDVASANRKDSNEYILDVLDGSNQNLVQAGATQHVQEPVVDIVSMTSRPDGISQSATSSENLVNQHDLSTLSEKDVDVVNIANATLSCGPFREEERVLGAQPGMLASRLEIKAGTQQPVGSGLISSSLLAELAFSDDVEEKQIMADAAIQQPHWERYMDSATNKSFYYNPATNETQWTNPEVHAAINSIGTPATPQATATSAAGPDTATSLWQEFLDEASGQLYYYNTKTGECSWEAPAAGSDAVEVVASPQSVATAESTAIGASPWIMYIDPASQAPYYANLKTQATTWEQPEGYVVATGTETKVVMITEAAVTDDAYVIAVDD